MFGVLSLRLTGCAAAPAPRTATIHELAQELDSYAPVAHRFVLRRPQGVRDLAQLPALAGGEYRVHMIDVGSGLAVLIQGTDFNLLFDGGSADARPDTLRSYLESALGERTVDHVILSHPHSEHASMLAGVVDRWQVRNLWDVGIVHPVRAYRELWRAAAAERGITVHTVRTPPSDRILRIGRSRVFVPQTVGWDQFGEGKVVELGEGARFTVLHADAAARIDLNENSLVVRVDLGATSVLLMGDAEGGPHRWALATPTDTEGKLLRDHLEDIDVDILQVGQHGAPVASRRAFLRAVSPALGLVSAGPTPHRGERLPNRQVLAELQWVGAYVVRTDDHDATGCPVYDPFGNDRRRAAGCDNVVIDVPAP